MKDSRASEISDLDMENQKEVGEQVSDPEIATWQKKSRILLIAVYCSGLLDTVDIQVGLMVQNCPPNISVLIFSYEK